MRVFAANAPDVSGEGTSKFELPPSMVRQKSVGSEDDQKRSWISKLFSIRFHKVARLLVEDWFFLAALGVIMAFCSFAMDFAIEHLQKLHVTLYNWANGTSNAGANILLTYLAWVGFLLSSVISSALLVHYIAPQAIGSGIPEMKTILRGVILKEYLTFRTLVSKMIGLTLSLGSGLPIGKEGPFVHVASVVATVLSKLVTSFKGIYANESRNSEMLAAACAVGVACTFSAPVGGVLFSIEVTSVYFAVRNYWRGFFAAACSATVFRLLRVVMKDTEVTVVAFFQTDFPKEAFYPEELPIFALIGVICGFAGALFVYLHRTIVLFIRKNKCAKKTFQRNLLIYPSAVAILVGSLTYPQGYGRFIAGQLKFSEALQDFFSNCTWLHTPGTTTACDSTLLQHWTGIDGEISIFVTLTCYTLTIFVLGALSNTLPIPAGVFMPVFVIGAAFGRMIGEAVAAWFSDGFRGPGGTQVFPGVYAVVGAAAFCGAVTHTVSVSVIVFELTGQLMYILPVMIAVLIANAICAYLQPSIYDSIIKIKHLPYLPDIPPASSIVHGIRAEQIMVRNVKYLSKATTYGELQDCLYSMPRLRAFPIVDDPKSMVLLGSVPKRVLDQMLEKHVGVTARKAEAQKRVREAIQSTDRQFQASLNPSDTEDEIVSVHDDPQPQDSGDASGGTRFTVVPVANRRTLNTRRSAFSSEAPQVHVHAPDNADKIDVEQMSDQQQSSVSRLSLDPNRTLSGNNFNNQLTIRSLSSANVYHTIEGYVHKISHKLSINRFAAYQKNGAEYDLNDEERTNWEAEQLEMVLDMEDLRIDPAPFQLVERTSLFKVHSLFSLLGLNRAYVTNCGRLIGVVALRELRIALERAQAGLLVADADAVLPVDVGSPTSDNGNDSDPDDNILQPRLEVVEREHSRTDLDAIGSDEGGEGGDDAEKAEKAAPAAPANNGAPVHHVQQLVVPTINISDETV